MSLRKTSFTSPGIYSQSPCQPELSGPPAMTSKESGKQVMETEPTGATLPKPKASLPNPTHASRPASCILWESTTDTGQGGPVGQAPTSTQNLIPGREWQGQKKVPFFQQGDRGGCPKRGSPGDGREEGNSRQPSNMRKCSEVRRGGDWKCWGARREQARLGVHSVVHSLRAGPGNP